MREGEATATESCGDGQVGIGSYSLERARPLRSTESCGDGQAGIGSYRKLETNGLSKLPAKRRFSVNVVDIVFQLISDKVTSIQVSSRCEHVCVNRLSLGFIHCFAS